jgi:threonyl-tRNA synthetase
VEMDNRSEKIGYKIREGQLQKIPYLLVLGDREMEEHSVSVRHRKRGDLGSRPLKDFAEEIIKEINERTLE